MGVLMNNVIIKILFLIFVTIFVSCKNTTEIQNDYSEITYHTGESQIDINGDNIIDLSREFRTEQFFEGPYMKIIKK